MTQNDGSESARSVETVKEGTAAVEQGLRCDNRRRGCNQRARAQLAGDSAFAQPSRKQRGRPCCPAASLSPTLLVNAPR